MPVCAQSSVSTPAGSAEAFVHTWSGAARRTLAGGGLKLLNTALKLAFTSGHDGEACHGDHAAEAGSRRSVAVAATRLRAHSSVGSGRYVSVWPQRPAEAGPIPSRHSRAIVCTFIVKPRSRRTSAVCRRVIRSGSWLSGTSHTLATGAVVLINVVWMTSGLVVVMNASV